MSTPVTVTKLSVGELLGTYNKAIVGLIIAFLSAYSQALPNGITTSEWWSVVGTTVVATGAIWLVPMTPKWLATYGKSVAGFIVALAGSLTTASVAGTIGQEAIVNAILAGLLTFGGVVIAPNAASSDPVGADGKIVAIPADVKEALAIPGTTAVTTVTGSDGVTYVQGAADVSEPDTLPADPAFEEDGGAGEDNDAEPEAKIVVPVENPDKGI